MSDFASSKVKRQVFSMQKLKAPGPNVYNNSKPLLKKHYNATGQSHVF